jgi:hypothetical protein
MPRLQINPGTSTSWEVELKPGLNRLGRRADNDFTIDHPSVSGNHCQIDVNNGSAIIKDLGSTNGTFVDRAPVQETPLQAGQTIHLGNVEMVFHADSPRHVTIAHRSTPPILTPTAPPTAPVMTATGTHYCKFHPKTLGRYLCNQCHLFFCELCITSRNVEGVAHKFCRRCGAECVPVQVRVQRPVHVGFFARLPGAFAYPFRGAGVLLLIVGMVVVGALKFGGIMMGLGSIRFLVFGVLLQIVAGGYLFTFLQSIIHSTAAEDHEMPDLPGMSNFIDDILMPALRFLGLTLISFGPMLALAIWGLVRGEPPPAFVMIPAAIFGCFYFPMSFLAVAMLDSVGAANPLNILPSIFKVPREYLVTLVLLAAIYFFRALGDVVLKALFPEGFTTHSMTQLFLMVAALAFWGFTSLYLLTVNVRILGLLYVTKKEKLGWLNR